ncbi:MAG: acetylornithine/succinylornithine family transaminase [Micavibrio sp.]|nr:acetylornithine/succinylornithine family transaminase [Micavibrio sp.]
MTQNAKDIIAETEKLLINTYNAQPVVMDRGEGVYAWDTDGKKYLDFAAGIAVASLGHAPKAVLKTLNEQGAKMITTQTSYATLPKLEASKIIIENGCFDQVYWCNSGTEAIEAALKTVRKWAYDNKSKDAHEIIAFRKSFHGRTYGSASITEKSHSQPFFGPYIPGIKWAKLNDLQSVKDVVSDKTCAIIVEPVQGEGGLMPATTEFLQGLRDLCDKNDIALIFDEIQTGMGRLGYFNAYEAFGVEPDIATHAKGLGSGFPVGAMLAKRRIGSSIVVGTHGTTYGGNPLACAVAATVMKEILKPGFLENVRKTGVFFLEGLKKLKRDSNKITDIRGKGLLIGLDTTVDIKKLLKNAQSNGLLATQAGDATYRMSPPLIVNEQQAQEAINILAKTLKEAE